MPFRNEEPPASPGRPRDTSREVEILQAVLALLAEQGYDALTFEAVARRAHASKATLYRRWDNKRDMVVAAIKAGPSSGTSPEAVDTGSLHGDLLELCGRLDATLRASDGSMSLMLLQAGLEDPDLCRHIEESAGPTGAKLTENVLDAAISRGELPKGTRPFAYDEVAGSVLLLRRLNGLPAGADYLARLVDDILIPALKASAANDTEPPHAIFA
ncbi:TetR family transcriptional regulator [Flexivirga endophytica]|uniref:TetR family transcriptional regulator n=1 Tax=Flexivirga endophytica TaxID=1849103 RepID=A0A916TEV9_9MICO|nr:TetR/AcrR family transcriptional regulator [Flexivirga endophytica]GGB40012.1 TetR family transcriptional regulator [Flexivirga endophytica]GHB47899.1 TetR family transcriptional regulator [Flexivirga endophytica]